MSRQPPPDWSPPGQFSQEEKSNRLNFQTTSGLPPVSRRVCPRTRLITDSLETPASQRDSFPWMFPIITGQTTTATISTSHLIPTGYQGNFPRADFHETSLRTEYQWISPSKHFSLIELRQVFPLNLHEILR